ncbi:MAG: tRNA (adenosine(37)-N6)-threonylcarbamoyltransferase complex transferase subunit TsaD [Clostridia bacterium]
MIILSIETSCDETSVAITNNGREVLSNVVFTQIAVHTIYGGVVPEIASRMHTEKLSELTLAAINEAKIAFEDVEAVAVSYAPGLIGALLTGVAFAKALAFSLNVPLIPVHHIRGHIASCYITFKELTPPFICLIASGSHSHIVKVNDYTDYEILGATKDDAPGEAFDKVARLLGLGYPGGVKIDKLFSKGDSKRFKFPKVTFKDNPYNFSFSGVKTNVINLVHNMEQKGEEVPVNDVCASFNQIVAETLVEKLHLACINEKATKVAICGGVSANSVLRKLALDTFSKDNITLYLPDLSLCGDNAAMIGCAGYYEYKAGNIGDMYLNAKSNSPIN